MNAFRIRLSTDVPLRAALGTAALLGFLASLPGLDPWHPVPLVILVASLLWALAFESRLPRLMLPPRARIVLLMGGSAVFIFSLSSLHSPTPEDFSILLNRYLVWNIAVFLLSTPKAEHDHWTLVIFTFSFFMISATFLKPVLFIPLFLASFHFLLYAFHRIAHLRSAVGGKLRPGSPSLLISASTAVLLLAAFFFFTFPRDLFNLKGSDAPPSIEGDPVPTGEEAGLRGGIPSRTRRVELTTLEKLKDNPFPQLRILLMKPDRSPFISDRLFYLRAVTYDTYVDGRWEAEESTPHLLSDTDGDGNTETGLPSPRDALRVLYRIRMFPHEEGLCFSLPEPISIDLPSIEVHEHGILSFPLRSFAMREYEAVSDLPVPAHHAALVRITDFPTQPKRYLSLPEGLSSVESYAENFGAIHNRARRLLALQHRLQSDFRYDRTPFDPAPGTDPIEHFLTVKRGGTCMHFATAMTLIARELGYPARVAAGFHFRAARDGRAFNVSGSQAHAWCEVLMEDYGWVVFDATPEEGPSGRDVATRTSAGQKETEEEEEVEDPDRRWDDFLLGYDPGYQGAGLEKIREALRSVFRAVFAVILSPWFFIPLPAGLLLLLVSIRALPPSQRRRILRLLQPAGGRCPVPFYRDFLWMCARHALRKPAGMTADEFALHVKKRFPSPGIDRLTGLYQRVRFGGKPLTAEEIREVERILQEVETLLQKSGSAGNGLQAEKA